MPQDRFWAAVDALVAADEAGRDVGALAGELLAVTPSLGEHLQEAIHGLDEEALLRALDRSDGLPATEDALIAVACAVVAAGPEVYAEALRRSTADAAR